MPFELLSIPAAEAEFLLPILRDAEEVEERIRASFLDLACAVYAAWVEGKLVGAAVVHWDKDEASELLYIAVIAKQRGQGIGKQIISALQAELRERGGRVLLVGTANCSLENIAFYQKCGFRMFEIRRDFFDYIRPPLSEHGIQMRDMIVFRYELE